MPTSDQTAKGNKTRVKGKVDASPSPIDGKAKEKGLNVSRRKRLAISFDEMRVKLAKVDRHDLMVLIPGVSIMTMGALILFFPQFLVVASAFLLILAGGLVSMLTMKAVQLKRRLEKLSRDFEGQILVHRPVQREGYYVSKEDDKKVILH